MRISTGILNIGAMPLLASMLLACGCSRRSNDLSGSQTHIQTNQASAITNPVIIATPAQGQPLSGIPVTQTDGQPDMGELNRVARLWMVRNQRRPTSWDDFVAHAGVTIPPPPPGKKYVLSKSMQVSLEDR
jgi:hypothetical protein